MWRAMNDAETKDENAVHPATQELVDEWSRTSPYEIIHAARSVDTKMVGVLAAGSVVIGVIAAAIDVENSKFTVSLVAVIMAALAFIVVLASAWRCLSPKNFRQPLTREALDKKKHLPPDKFKNWHRELVLCTYENNKKLQATKAKMLWCGIVALGVEMLLISCWAILRFFGV